MGNYSTLQVVHRSAAGSPTSRWDYDPARHVVDLVFRLGSAQPVAFTVRVCAVDSPRTWSHPLVRLGADSWRMLPAIWLPGLSAAETGAPKLHMRDCAARGDTLGGSIPCELHRLISAGSHLILTHAPDIVNAELERLSA